MLLNLKLFVPDFSRASAKSYGRFKVLAFEVRVSAPLGLESLTLAHKNFLFFFIFSFTLPALKKKKKRL